MKIMIAEDNLLCRLILKKILSPYGECDMVVNGSEAVEAFKMALDDRTPYDLIWGVATIPAESSQINVVHVNNFLIK